MKQSISGNTILEDNDASVNIQMQRDGQILVFGQVGGSHKENYLKFGF